MLKPHWYQSDCVRMNCLARKKEKKTAFNVLASGLGKTVTAAFDVLEFKKINPTARVLFLCNSMEVLRQARLTFEVILGASYSYGFFAGKKREGKTDFVFAMFQTMRKHCQRFLPDEFDYVVVDESHHTYAETYLDVVEYWTPKFLLGMTATPDRTDGQDITRVFGKPVFYLPLEEALAQDLLTPVDYRLLTDEIVIPKEVPARWRSVRRLNREFFMRKRDEEIVKIINRHTKDVADPRMIVFCPSIDYCEHMASLMPGSMPYHSKVPAEERIIRFEMFRNGMIPTLLVVDAFNEGVDVPSANILVFLRSTTSPIVFLQQLGRGLRLDEGKDKVIVLDFVANCQRVQTIYELMETVKVHRRKLSGTKKSPIVRKRPVVHVHEKPFPFLVDGGNTEFGEKILRLLEIVQRVSDSYSREDLIFMLQQLAKKLGHSPTQLEVTKDKTMPSSAMYMRVFGSHSEALAAAGLPVNQILNVTKKELLDQLRKLHQVLGHVPSQDEVDEASKHGDCSSEPVFRKHFGSLAKALTKIGLKASREVGLSKKDLIAQLILLKEKLGRTPSVDDIKKSSAAGVTASYMAFYKRFGGWQRALVAAKLLGKVTELVRLTPAQLIQDLLMAQKILGKTPTATSVNRLQKAGKLVSKSLMPFYTHFGSFPNALKAAGITK